MTILNFGSLPSNISAASASLTNRRLQFFNVSTHSFPVASISSLCLVGMWFFRPKTPVKNLSCLSELHSDALAPQSAQERSVHWPSIRTTVENFSWIIDFNFLEFRQRLRRTP